MAQEWLTVQETQDRLNVSRSTLCRWAKRGVLPIYKLGFRTVVKAEDVARVEQKASKPRLLYPGAPARYPTPEELSDIK